MTIRIATRKSPLALAQSQQVADLLVSKLKADIVLVPTVTIGDKQLNWSLEKQGGKGLFTKEIEEALLGKDADIAVHSAKDLPGDNSPGLSIAGYLPRENPSDTLVVREGILHPASIATSSARRRLQIGKLHPGAAHMEIRGNIDTRLRKIATDHIADATLIATAALRRLHINKWPGLSFVQLPAHAMTPAVAQGAIAIQCRAEDAKLYAPLLDPVTASHVSLERAFQSALGAGCHTAFAAYATDTDLHLFHEKIGYKHHSITSADINHAEATAQRILKEHQLL